MGRTPLDQEFSTLGSEFCSLGQDENYYETLAAFPDEIQEEILRSLRDVVRNQGIAENFDEDQAFQTSMLRSIGAASLKRFRDVLTKTSEKTAFGFTYRFPSPNPAELSFSTNPGSKPPSNIHVLIGSNGVGKTRLLRNLASIMTGKIANGDPIVGEITFHGEPSSGDTPVASSFANLVTMAFSAFDPFPPEDNGGTSPRTSARPEFKIKDTYIGLKQSGSVLALKTAEKLEEEFVRSALTCLRSASRDRWLAALRVLSSDLLLGDMRLAEVDEIPGDLYSDFLKRAFETASSGHRLVLLSISRLIEVVGERSLVLIDEPETHLHPPLQAAFIRAVSELMTARNGIALVATHSPVILQEVPGACAWMLYRRGDSLSAERPELETFAENVGVLTREVFRLEVTESGYHAIIRDESTRHASYDEILGAFSGQVGTEGRALIRALLRSKTP